MTFPSRPILRIDYQTNGLILALWKQGYDTAEIAQRLSLRQHQVANALARLRDAER